MMKVILKGTPNCKWDLGSMRSGGTELDLTETELKIAEKNNLIECYINEKEHFKGRFIYEALKTKKKKVYLKEELEKKEFTELKKIGKKFNVTDRSKTKLIKEILEAQK